MKRVLKIVSIIIAVILTMIILLSVIAKIKENEIAEIALKKIGKSINAPIVIDDISLSLIRRFPLATIELEGVWLGSPDAFGLSDSLITSEETLAKIEKVYISVKSIPLFKGEFEIMKVEIRGVDFSYIVNTRGISNFDFLINAKQKDSSDTTAVSLNIILKELILRDIHCNYYDSLNLVSAEFVIPKAEVNGEIRDEYLHGSASGALKLLNCNYKATPLHLMKDTEIDFDVAYSEGTVNVKELIVSTDGANFNITGSVVIKDTIETDLHIQGTKLNFGELIKYIPEKTLENTGLKKASGMLTMDASIKGFASDSILPEVKIDMTMKNGYIEKTGYPTIRNISFTGYATNGKLRNNKTTSVNIREFHAETRESSVDMTFSLNNPDRIQYKINSDLKIDLGEFKEFIPDSIISDAKGQILARLVSKGIFPNSIGHDFFDYLLETSRLNLTLNNLFLTLNPTLSLDSLSGQLAYDLHHITARNLQIHIPQYRININNTSFDAQLSGKLSEPSKLGIDLKSFQIRTDSSVFYGSAKVLNLKAPEYNITCNSKLNLSEIKNIVPDTLVNDLSGEIIAQIASDGKLNLDSIPSQINDLIFKNSSFGINFSRVSVNMPDTLMHIKEFSGKLEMKSDTIIITNTRGVYSGIDFGIDSTKIVNLYNSVIQNQASRLYIEGRFNLGDLDYTMFVPFIKETTDTVVTSADKLAASLEAETKEHSSSKSANYTYLVKGKLRIRSFRYNKAFVDNISALFNLTDSLYLVDQFKFDGFGGKHNTSVRYSVDGEDKILWVKNEAEKMNVAQLLQDFDNFKEFYEPSITYENISGILSSRVDGQIFFKGDSLLRNEMRVRGDIKLEKGGIYNYPPVEDIAQYLPGIDNLKKLEFKTIKSNVFVFKDAVYVPITLIVSNKLDASALGMQSFGKDYSYHFIVFLRDILTGKSKKRLEKQDEMGEEISSADRKGTMVKSYSINGKNRSGLDNEKDREEMKTKVLTSEKLLNVRFHPKVVNYNTGVK